MRRASLAALILAGGAAVPAVISPVIPAATAQGLSESILRATISQSVEADSNFNLDAESPGTTYFGDTRVGVSLLQTAPTQRLRFSFNTGLRPIKQPDKDFEWNVATPSAARLNFAQDFANNAFDISAGARLRRVDGQFIDQTADPIGPFGPTDPFDPFDPEVPLPDLPADELDALPDDVDLITDEVLEQRYDVNTGFTTGTNAPSSLGFRLRATTIDYSGDNADQFTARTSADGEALWRLRLNPVLSGAVFAGYRYQDADNDQETQIQEAELDLGVIYEPREELEFTLGAGYSDREERRTVGGERTTEDNTGVVLRGNVRYLTPDFVLGANARFTTAAPEQRFSGDLRATYRLPRSRITARLFQDFALGSDLGDERRITGLGLGYTYSINALSNAGLNLDASNSAAANSDEDGDGDRSQVDVTARYSRNLTSLVNASLGYTLRQRFDDPDDATSHRVFFNISRAFQTTF